jgi:hypothetical protein
MGSRPNYSIRFSPTASLFPQRSDGQTEEVKGTTQHFINFTPSKYPYFRINYLESSVEKTL